MSSIRLVFKVIGAVWFIAMVAIGIGGTYLEHNPEAAGAYALGTMNVDPKANVFKQAGQMVAGYATARDGISAMKNMSHSSDEWQRDMQRDREAMRRYSEAREAGWGEAAAAEAARRPAGSDVHKNPWARDAE